MKLLFLATLLFAGCSTPSAPPAIAPAPNGNSNSVWIETEPPSDSGHTLAIGEHEIDYAGGVFKFFDSTVGGQPCTYAHGGDTEYTLDVVWPAEHLYEHWELHLMDSTLLSGNLTYTDGRRDTIPMRFIR